MNSLSALALHARRIPTLVHSVPVPLAALSRKSFHYSAMASQQEDGPVATSIRSSLVELLDPVSIEIINDSAKHAHHSAMRGVSSKETHFRVNIVSEAFAGKSTMQRHRLIYGALKKDFAEGLHALSLSTKTPTELAKASEAE